MACELARGLGCQNGMIFDHEQGLTQTVMKVYGDAAAFFLQLSKHLLGKHQPGELLVFQSPLQQMNPKQGHGQYRQ
jgi:hypothetical protein